MRVQMSNHLLHLRNMACGIEDLHQLVYIPCSTAAIVGYRIHRRVRPYRMGRKVVRYDCYDMTGTMASVAKTHHCNFVLV